MPDPNDLEPRVTALERDVASAAENASQARAEAREALMLARACDRDQGGFTDKLIAHTQTLNALRETQLEQGQVLTVLQAGQHEHASQLAEYKVHLSRLEREMRDGFANVTALLMKLVDRRG